MVSGDRAEEFQVRGVLCIPVGRPLFLNAAVVGLEAPEFAVQVVLESFWVLGAFQFGFIELLGYFLSLGLSLRLDKEVQPGDDEAVVRLAVGAAHGFGRNRNKLLPILHWWR